MEVCEWSVGVREVTGLGLFLVAQDGRLVKLFASYVRTIALESRHAYSIYHALSQTPMSMCHGDAGPPHKTCARHSRSSSTPLHPRPKHEHARPLSLQVLVLYRTYSSSRRDDKPPRDLHAPEAPAIFSSRKNRESVFMRRWQCLSRVSASVSSSK